MNKTFTTQEAQKIIDMLKPRKFDAAFDLLYRAGYVFGEPDQFLAYDNDREEWCICTCRLDAQNRNSFISVCIVSAANDQE